MIVIRSNFCISGFLNKWWAKNQVRSERIKAELRKYGLHLGYDAWTG
jgi:hypothetical protein